MASTVDQKTYLLNKYLKGSSGDKKKKRKKKNVKGTGLRIIDDDVDTSRLRPLEDEELEALGLGDEDAPQVAGIVDERPEEVRKMEQFGQGSKWRVIAQNDGIDSKIRVEEIKRNITKMDEESHPIFGKMYSDSEDEKKNDTDLSPPRKDTNNSNKSSGNKEQSKNKQIHRGSDSDLSPPRSRKRKKSTDSDQSPPRRNKQVEVNKDDRKREENSYKRESPSRKKRNRSSDSDLSPPRRKEHEKSRDKPRKPSRWGNFGPEEPITKNNGKSEDSDLSPPRKSRSKRSVSPQRQKDSKSKRERSEDSDLSPPRKSKRPSPPSDIPQKSRKANKRDSMERSPPRRSRNEQDSDLSPPRKSKRPSPPSDIPQKSRKANKRDSMERSPPRRSRNEQSRSNRSPENAPSSRVADERMNSRNRSKDIAERGRERYNDRRRKSDSPPPSNKKMAKTLEGKMAGLQDAQQMRDENADFRRREDELYNNMSAELSGRNATAVNRRLGKRETSADREKKRADQEKQKEMEAKYDKWGKGLKQVSDQTARVEDYLHEASKPLARHRDDVDLERTLKAQERAGDPMLEYMRGKKTERSDVPERPTYKGNWPPNRFNIRPGYRWDGVDRSNGYEKKYFDHKSKAKALAEEAYKWSTEDL